MWRTDRCSLSRTVDFLKLSTNHHVTVGIRSGEELTREERNPSFLGAIIKTARRVSYLQSFRMLRYNARIITKEDDLALDRPFAAVRTPFVYHATVSAMPAVE
jgi:hypothetical protein